MRHANDSSDIGFEHVWAAVAAFVENVYSSLESIAAATRSLWDRFEANGETPRSTDLASLRDVVIAELQHQGTTFNGAGIAVADGALCDCPRYLEWWRPDHRHGGSAQRLTLDLDPTSEYFYDYSTMEWFAVPRDRGTRWVYGPYLDYTGVDLYVCTFAVPVTSSRGTFLGIAGADVPVSRLDVALMPTFTAAKVALALANAEGRVIVANHADHVTGSKIRGVNAAASRPVPSTPWSLVQLAQNPDAAHGER